MFTSTESRHVKEVVTSARGRRSVAGHPVGLCRRQLLRYYLGWRHDRPDGALAYFVSLHGIGQHDAGPGGVRLRPGGLRLPGHGPGDHRGRLLRPGHRQRAIGLRAFADRTDPEHRRANIKKDFGFDAELRARQGFAGGQRRRRQHLQGDSQAGADRHRRRGRHHDDLLHHHGPDPRAHA